MTTGGYGDLRRMNINLIDFGSELTIDIGLVDSHAPEDKHLVEEGSRRQVVLIR